MKKILRCVIALTLCFACVLQLGGTAFAATFSGKKYVSDVTLSYGNTDEEAKSWLTSHGYKVVDCNLNDGADDVFSRKRSVFLGYKETSDAEKAICDMRLMNMNGGYSVSDYKLVLDEMKANIRSFITNFIVTVSEYRTNYENGKPRAVAVHDMLNLLADDDTEELLGDLLLRKIREEYTEEEFSALSVEEQKRHADVTTILMQGNKNIVLAIEQILAMAADDNDSLWLERYESAESYDAMFDRLIDEGLNPREAANTLASKYDHYASVLASKIEGYREYMNNYLACGVTMESSEQELNDWAKDKTEREVSAFLTAGAQYETLKSTVYDKDYPEGEDNTMLDLFLNEDYDLEGADRCMLYPIVSTFSTGQLACLEFLTMFQIVMLGMNDENAFKETVDEFGIFDNDKGCISVFAGVDRGIYGDNAALTNEALRLQNSSDADYTDYWFGEDGLGMGTMLTYLMTSVTFLTSVTLLVKGFFTGIEAEEQSIKLAENLERRFNPEYFDDFEVVEEALEESMERSDSFASTASEIAEGRAVVYDVGSKTFWQKVFFGVGAAFAVVTIALSVVAVWRTVEELKEYYNTEFSPIPKYMVDESQNDKGEKVFTYYTVVSCNRQESGFMEDRTKNLKNFGDVNGDVGREWVALYVTKDRAAGAPITCDFLTQIGSSDVPDGKTPLSMFGENTAQNLTNKKKGYTFDDRKGGIYLFYGVDESAFTATAITGGVYALIGAVSFAVAGALAYVMARRGHKVRRVTENA